MITFYISRNLSAECTLPKVLAKPYSNHPAAVSKDTPGSLRKAKFFSSRCDYSVR